MQTETVAESGRAEWYQKGVKKSSRAAAPALPGAHRAGVRSSAIFRTEFTHHPYIQRMSERGDSGLSRRLVAKRSVPIAAFVAIGLLLPGMLAAPKPTQAMPEFAQATGLSCSA